MPAPNHGHLSIATSPGSSPSKAHTTANVISRSFTVHDVYNLRHVDLFEQAVAACKRSSLLNARDAYGRTVLHRAASSRRSDAPRYVQALLANLQTSMNSVDEESGWTALHRAMYMGNLRTVQLLLSRNDIDAHIKDREGLTAFELYNTTVKGTSPAPASLATESDRGNIELLTWGSNKNYVLGHSTDGDRLVPERVDIQRMGVQAAADTLSTFQRGSVKKLAFSKLHAAIITNDLGSNVRLCGFGNGGRLGHSANTQLAFGLLFDLRREAVDVALGQDHTVIVTVGGEVWTFGLNNFSQLGYPIEPAASDPSMSSTSSGPRSYGRGSSYGGMIARDEQMQLAPKRVISSLKKEFVIGAAASRVHTVVFTSEAVYVWGTNYGQLGIATSSTPVQASPRVVTLLTTPVISVAATDSATACILNTRDIVVLQDGHLQRVVFALPTSIGERPAQILSRPTFDILKAAGDTFVTVSEDGEVFSWTAPSIAAMEAPSPPRPHKVWHRGRKFSGAIDAAVGMDGSVILCTRSGHVYIRSRKATSAGASQSATAASKSASIAIPYRTARVPHLNRVIAVAANESGAYGALREEPKVQCHSVASPGRGLSRAMLHLLEETWGVELEAAEGGLADTAPDDEEVTDSVIMADVQLAATLATKALLWEIAPPPAAASTNAVERARWRRRSAGADLYFLAQNRYIPAHQAVIRSRSEPINRLIEDYRASDRAQPRSTSPAALQVVLELSTPELIVIRVPGQLLTHLLAVLFMYGDRVPAFWDSRIARGMRSHYPSLSFAVTSTHEELLAAAHRTYSLPTLAKALVMHQKVDIDRGLGADLLSLRPSLSCPTGDVFLIVDGGSQAIVAHEAVLRSRCPLFSILVGDADWTHVRRGVEGTAALRIDLSHISAAVLVPVLQFAYGDDSHALLASFAYKTVDEHIDFLWKVLAAADELLIDDLKEACSTQLASLLNMPNCISLLADAITFNVSSLVHQACSYIARDLEGFIDRELIRYAPEDVLVALSRHCHERQSETLRVTRLLEEAFDADVHDPTTAVAVIDLINPSSDRFLTEMQATDPVRKFSRSGRRTESPAGSPFLTPSSPALPASTPIVDDIFSLDEELEAGLAGCALSGPHVPSEDGDASIIPRQPQPPRLQARPIWGKAPSHTRIEPANLRDIMVDEDRIQQKQHKPISIRPTSHSTTVPLSWRPAAAASLVSVSGGAPVDHALDVQQSCARRAAPTSTTPSRNAWRSAPSTALEAANLDRTSGVGAPVISPLRQSATPSKHNTGSGGTPWANYASTYSSASLRTNDIANSAKSAASFAAIQSEQHTEGTQLRQAPRSLVEIQREEAAAEVAKREEAAFLQWFAEEEARTRAQAHRSRQSSKASHSRRAVRTDEKRKLGRPKAQGTDADVKAAVAPVSSVPYTRPRATRRGKSTPVKDIDGPAT